MRAELPALYQVWMGRLALAEALQRRQVEFLGGPELARAFPGWFALSPAAAIVREVREAS